MRGERKHFALAVRLSSHRNGRLRKLGLEDIATRADLDHQRAVLGQMIARLRQDAPHDVEPVLAAGVRDLGSAAYSGGKAATASALT